MNQKTIAAIIILMVALVACRPGSLAKVASPVQTPTSPLPLARAEAVSPIQTPTPLPPIGIGVPVEVKLDTTAVSIDGLFNLVADGDFIFANIQRNKHIEWLAIKSRGGQVYGSGANVQLNDPSIPQRYQIRFQGGSPNGPGNQIIVYDLHNLQESSLPILDQPWRPDLNGSRLAWVQYHNGRGSVVIYDLDTKSTLKTISDKTGSNSVNYPHIAGDWVGYTDRDMTRSVAELNVYNLSTGEILHLDTIPYYESGGGEPYAIRNGRVAWIKPDAQKRANLVHVYDLNLKQERILNDPLPGCMAAGLNMTNDFVIWGCTGHWFGFDPSRNIQFEIPVVPPGVDFQDLNQTLFSDTCVNWVVAMSDGHLHLYAAPIVRR